MVSLVSSVPVELSSPGRLEKQMLNDRADCEREKYGKPLDWIKNWMRKKKDLSNQSNTILLLIINAKFHRGKISRSEKNNTEKKRTIIIVVLLILR